MFGGLFFADLFLLNYRYKTVDILFRIGVTALVYGLSSSLCLVGLWLAGLPSFFERIGNVVFLLGFPFLLYGLSVTVAPLVALLVTCRWALTKKAQWLSAVVFVVAFGGVFAFLFDAASSKAGAWLFEPSLASAQQLRTEYQQAVDAHYDALRGKDKSDICKVGTSVLLGARQGPVFTLPGVESSRAKDIATALSGFDIRVRGVSVFVSYDARRLFHMIPKGDCAAIYLEQSAALLSQGDRPGAYLAADLSGALADGLADGEILRDAIQKMRKRITDTGYAPQEREPGVRWVDGVGYYEDEEGGAVPSVEMEQGGG